MKKTVKQLGLAFASLVLFSNVCSSQSVERTSPIPYNVWYTVSKISPEVYLIDERHYATCYLVLGKEKALLIDTGNGGGDLSGQVKALTSLPVMVINTHGHSDHIGGNYQYEEVWMAAPDTVLSAQYYERSAWFRMVEFVRETKNLWKNSDNVDAEVERLKNIPPSKINLVADGDKIDLGGKEIEVCTLSGHTPGCIVLIDRKDGILFSGDAIITHLLLNFSSSTSLEAYSSRLDQIIPRFKGLAYLYHGHEQQLGVQRIDFVDRVQAHIHDIIDGKVIGKLDNTDDTPAVKYEFSDWVMLLKPEEAEMLKKRAKSKY